MHSDIFEKNIAIPGHAWQENFKPEYTFNITDTSSSYDLKLTFRHTDAYPYANLWLKVTMQQPGETKDSTLKIEIPLAQENGKWLGKGMNEIWEHELPLSKNANVIRFKKTGMYKIKLQHIMRVNPLPQVMSIGVRLVKIESTSHNL
ncbi:MAG: gliding motility lipoprotein GldH [Bacteroidetes bacterium]|nr:gliding motility lipoprotein GldH [Bacteroidota bacterium]